MAEAQQGGENESQEEIPANLQDVAGNNYYVNSQGKLVKARKKKKEFTEEENALILRWLEAKYKDLYGRGAGSTVAQDKQDAWDEFTTELNNLHGGQNSRTQEDIMKRIDNMKNQARNKNKLWGKHITGNPPPCTLFNEQDLAILRILGDTPSFRGIRTRAFDTPIVMAAPSNRNQAAVAIQCNAGVEAGPSIITASLNTGGANLNPSDMLACLQQEKKDRLLLQEEQQLARLEEAAPADEELGIVSVQPTIQFNAAEPVRVQVPGKNAEDIITLELEADIIPPTPVTSTETAKSAAPTCKGKSVRGRGVKRTYSSTNTAPDYAESAAQNDSIFSLLPIEIRAKILNHLTCRDLINAGQTCFYLFQALGLTDSFKEFNANEFKELSQDDMAVIRTYGSKIKTFALKGDDMWLWVVRRSFWDVLAPMVNLHTLALSHTTCPATLRFLTLLPQTLRVLQLDCLLYPAQEFIQFLPPLGPRLDKLALTGQDQLTRFDLVTILQHFSNLDTLDIRVSDYIRPGTAEAILNYCPKLLLFLFTTDFRVRDARAWVEVADLNFHHVTYDEQFYKELVVHRETLEYSDEYGVIEV